MLEDPIPVPADPPENEELPDEPRTPPELETMDGLGGIGGCGGKGGLGMEGSGGKGKFGIGGGFEAEGGSGIEEVELFIGLYTVQCPFLQDKLEFGGIGNPSNVQLSWTQMMHFGPD